MARLHGQAKVINYRLIKELSQTFEHLMKDYSYHTVSSIINAFEKSINFHFNILQKSSSGKSFVPAKQ